MKKTIRCLSIVVTVTLLALPVFANAVNSRAGNTVQEPCSAETKLALYGEFYKELKADQAKAYEAAKKYVACPAAAPVDPPTTESKAAEAAEAARITYLKGFIGKYEKQNRVTQFTNLVIQKKYAEAFPLGKDILNNEQPDNLGIMLDVVYSGLAANSAALSADTAVYAAKAIQLLESGKAPDKWERFPSKDEALAYSHHSIANDAFAKGNYAEAIPHFIKAESYESQLKKNPLNYFKLGVSYEKGPYDKLSADYKTNYQGKDETPESKLALENINQVVDRMVDAYARAVALAGTDADIKTKGTDAAAFYYKIRHPDDKTAAGLNDVIASVLSKPLPPEPTPLTSLPTPPATPATGPGTSTSGAAPAVSNGTGTPAKTTAASSPVKTPGTKP